MISGYDVVIECDTEYEPDEEIVSPVFAFGDLAENSLQYTRYTHHTPDPSCKKKCRESDESSADESVDIEWIHR